MRSEFESKITEAQIDSLIEYEQYYVFSGSSITVCCLTLRNGFTVIGESGRAFHQLNCDLGVDCDADVGKKIAYENAKQKIWLLEGYLLREKLYEDEVKNFISENDRRIAARKNTDSLGIKEYIYRITKEKRKKNRRAINYFNTLKERFFG